MTVFNHPEDVKGALRKKFGSVAAFERARGLPEQAVRDVLRGKSRSKIARALARELGVSVGSLKELCNESHNRDSSSGSDHAHRLNAEAR